MTVSDYLDAVCAGIKYRSIHREVREELSTHIYETAEELGCSLDEAVKYMGSPDEIGNMFNKYHRMPFNSRYGLFLWAALYAFLICMTYPLVLEMLTSNNYTTFSKLTPLMIIFAIVNKKLLKRCRFKMLAADAAEVAIGGAAGIVISMAAVIALGLAGFWSMSTRLGFEEVSYIFNIVGLIFLAAIELSALIIYFSSCINSSPKGEAPYYELIVFKPMQYDVETAFGSDDKKSTDK